MYLVFFTQTVIVGFWGWRSEKSHKAFFCSSLQLSKANFSCYVLSSYGQCSMKKLAGDLLLGLKFVKLEILSTSFIDFLYDKLGELRSRSLGVMGSTVSVPELHPVHIPWPALARAWHNTAMLLFHRSWGSAFVSRQTCCSHWRQQMNSNRTHRLKHINTCNTSYVQVHVLDNVRNSPLRHSQ